MRQRNKTYLIFAFFIIMTMACSINNINISEKPNYELTITAQAVAIQQTASAQSLPPQQNNSNPAPSPVTIVITATQEIPPAPTNTAEQSASKMINSTLCWVGPGTKYEVMSSLSKGQNVDVIGRGDTKGWIIIRNPLYNDPCWVQAFDIQLAPSVVVDSLQIFYPPPPPTKTPVPPTPTPP